MVAETADARSLVFDATPREVPYRPGQFLTLRLPGGAARSYSLASSPHAGERLKVTVKRMARGFGSNWICDNVEAGSTVEALPPAGTFTPGSLDDDLLLFAGGSGITPIVSIATSALREGRGRIALIYANRDEGSVIFARDLAELAREHPNRLTVVHWLVSLQGRPGRAELAALARPYTHRAAFVCGPDPFMDAVAGALTTLAVPRDRIHTERFVSLSGDPFAEPGTEPAPVGESPTDTPTDLRVDLDDEEYRLTWPPRTRLLDLLLESGVRAPYSCRQGECSACACRVVDGEVTMLANDILDGDDLAEGWVLACQSMPVSPTVTVSYA